MNHIRLSTSYRLYAFPDYKAMTEAKPLMKRIAIAKQVAKLREVEAKHYLMHVGSGYKNYLRTDTADTKAKGLESLITALQALYKLNRYSAKYIIIESV